MLGGLRRSLASVLVLATVLSTGLRAGAVQQPVASTLDESIPPGANYDKAEFRLWLPPDSGRVQAIVVLVPGSNGDGRPMADDAVWQAFATKHKLALVACRFTDKPHIVGRSLDVAEVLFEDVLALRGTGDAFTEKSGWLGDLKGKTFDRVPDAGTPNYPTAWLPTERVGRAWKSLVTETPLPND